MTTRPQRIIISCDYSGQPHVADYDHDGQFGQGPIYTAVCTCGDNWYEDNYTLEAELPGYTVDPARTGPMGMPVAAPVRALGAAA